MKRRKFNYGFHNPKSKAYQEIKVYLDRILNGESLSVKQIAELTGYKPQSVLNCYSHYLKQIMKKEDKNNEKK